MAYTPSENFEALIGDAVSRRDYHAHAAVLRRMSADVANYLAGQPRHASASELTLCIAAAETVPEPPSLVVAVRAAQPELTTAPPDEDAVFRLLMDAPRPLAPTTAAGYIAPPGGVPAPPDLTGYIREELRGLSPAPPAPRTTDPADGSVPPPPDLTTFIRDMRKEHAR